MAQQTTVSIPAETWTQLTNGDVTNITFQVLGNDPVFIKGTAGANAPSTTAGAFQYNSGDAEFNVAVADMFPGVSGVNRVYAYSRSAAQVVVSHA